MQRWVLHIDMDAFFASVEQLTRPTLAGRPVVVGGLGGRGVVAGCSYEAREYGVHSAMPMMRARRLLPAHAVVVSPRKHIYGHVSRRVFGIIRQRVPVVEQLSVDEGFMEPAELVGASTEQVIQWAQELRAEIRQQTGLPSSIGAGAGKQFAKIGSGLAKPNGVFALPVDRKAELFDPLAVDKLWGVGPVTAAKLHSMGIDTIGQLAELPLRDVEVSLGKTLGPALWSIARGVDDRPVKERDVAKSISSEFTYPEDLHSQAQMDSAVDRALDSAVVRLRKDGRGARTVMVKVRLADLSIHTRSETLLYATQDPSVLRAVARRIAFSPASIGPVRLVGVGFSGLDENMQEVLFPELEAQGAGSEIFEDTSASISEGVFEAGARTGGAGVGTGGVGGSGDTSADAAVLPTFRVSDSKWAPTADVHHPEFGHGWVQGSGHGIVSVRFESRKTGPGRMRSFKENDPDLQLCSPLCSLDWGINFTVEG